MKPAPPETWSEQNQRSLRAALATLRARLEDPDAPPEPRAPQAAMPAPTALETLRRAFGLSDFERDLLLLCAGVEFDGGIARAVATRAAPGVQPTFSLALADLEQPHWSALAPAAPLRHWRLIEMLDGPTLTSRPLRIDERVLHYLVGIKQLDERLAPLVEIAPPFGEVAPSHQRHAAAIVEAWTVAHGAPPLIQLIAVEAGSATAIAAQAAVQVGLQLARLRAADIPAAAREREEFTRLWEREAALSGLVLLVDCLELETATELRPACRLLAHAAAPVLALARQRLDLPERPSLHLAVGAPTRHERLDLWAGALAGQGIALNGSLGRVAGQFVLDAQEIRAIANELALGAPVPDGDGERDEETDEETAARLWALCRQRTRPRLTGLAQPIEPAATWDDLILPATQKQLLRDSAMHVRHRDQVYGDWGFAQKGRRGLGITALFSGPSGTGKTMAAEVLASELHLDLFRIDLSQVVSKYIGETEKNLGRLFDAAEGGGCILLFDEADALFGKRSEVRDSHDRYANLEVSYLLQRMEAFDGLAILTTNLKGALDPAFMRRIRFAVQFPFPDVEARAAIWRGVFPAATPLDGIDAERLARLSVAGGSIRNIALQAAFLAADAGEPVTMRHLLQAARTEAAKLERPLADAEIRGWLSGAPDPRPRERS